MTCDDLHLSLPLLLTHKETSAARGLTDLFCNHRYDMVTIEKWQGACAAQHAPLPMGNASCQQEQVIARTLRSIRAASSKKHQALMMYLNSNFAFTFYELTAQVAAVDGLLRDVNGEVCQLVSAAAPFCAFVEKPLKRSCARTTMATCT